MSATRSRLRLPKYVHGWVDKRGGGAKARHYFCRPGFKRVPLPGLPWSPQFMENYTAAMAGQMPIEIGSKRTVPGTVNALAVMYLTSAAFRSLAPSTQRMRRNLVERFRGEHGDKRFAMLQRDHVVRMLAGKIEKPAVARNWLHTIRALMAFAVNEGLRADDPTLGVKPPKIRGDGFETWTDDHIAQFETAHPIGSRARLALALLLYTAQRRSDVIRMGRQHVQNGAIHVRQQKTGTALSIPLHPELLAIIEAMPAGQMTFLITKDGQPFTGAGFGNWFHEMCDKAGLPKGLSAHGLRKAACRRLAEAGCSAHEIMSISGHASLREVQRYCAAVEQERLARAAMGKTLKART